MLKTLMPSLKELITFDYKAIKNPETERLVKACLTGLSPAAKPELLQVSGIPGAGKSTFCATRQKPDFLYLSFDRIMSQLSGYQKELKLNGAAAAYRKYEMPARIIGYEVLRRALKLRLNVMLEHSGTNKAHVELFKNIKKKGYKTAVDFIVCKPELAVKRAETREKKINRHVPRQVIEERAAKFYDYVAAYKKLTPEVAFFDGSDNFRPLNKI